MVNFSFPPVCCGVIWLCHNCCRLGQNNVVNSGESGGIVLLHHGVIPGCSKNGCQGMYHGWNGMNLSVIASLVCKLQMAACDTSPCAVT